MKKTMLFVTTLLLLVALTLGTILPAAATDEIVSGTWGDNITWELNKTTGELVISGEGKMDDFIHGLYLPTVAWHSYKESVKSVIIESGVASIGNSAFIGFSNMICIVISENVENIGAQAFRDCEKLEDVLLSNGLISIGEIAFYACKGLESIVLPETLTTIGDCAFEYCSNLSSITIPDGVTHIDSGMFYGTNLLQRENDVSYVDKWAVDFALFSNSSSIVVRDGTVGIGRRAFKYCEGVVSVELPDSLKYIGGEAFSECLNLKNITIPERVTMIGSYAFYKCQNLTSITIPNGVTVINDSVFSGCTSLTSVTIPNGITHIGADAFCNCQTLSNIIIPNEVRSIGSNAFKGCANFTELQIPDSVERIDPRAFEGCTGLEPHIQIENGVSYYEKWVIDCQDYVTSVALREDTAGIVGSAFSGCTRLNNVSIPNGVREIGAYVFEGCTSLTNIVLPDSVKLIGWRAFADCESLTSVALPNTVTTIEAWAFDGCTSLENIVIPEGITSIGSGAFANCKSLTDVVIPDGIETINDQVFVNCIRLKRVTIPKSVTSIEFRAFYNCSTLSTIVYFGTEEDWIRDIAKESSWDDYAGNYTIAFHSAHIFDDGVITTEPTHLTEGVKTFTCACGETKTEGVGKNPEHTYGDWSKHNAEQHKKECACGDVQYTSHAWNNGTITTYPTQTNEGVKTFSCDVCGETKTEIIEMLPAETQPPETRPIAPATDRTPSETASDKPTEALTDANKPTDNGGSQSGNSSGGCGSVLSGSVALMLLIGGAGCMIARKKKED